MPTSTSLLALAATAATLLLPPTLPAQITTFASSAPRPTAGTTRAAPIAVIDMERWRTRWTITATVGGAARRYLFDSGGGLSFVSAGTARAAGCTPWGRITGYNMFGRRGDGPRCDSLAFDVGGRRPVHLVSPIAGLIDMGKLNPGDSALDGIIGLNVFEGQAVTLDLAAGRIVVESDASLAERVRGATPIPIRVNREVSGFGLAVLAGVPSEKGTLWMELDSGNGGTVLVSKPVARLVGLDPDVDGKQNADFLVAGDARARTGDAFTPDMIMDGNLGMPFLKHWVVTLDLRSGKGWIAPAAEGGEGGAR